MKKILVSLMLGSLLFTACTTKTDQPDWQDLFNGTDLSGFVQRNGEANYEVIDSMIVGSAVLGSPNSFLCTENTYSDFILEMEYNLVDNMNSGIQIRSESYAEYKDGRVHGYQVEIDPSERAWSAGIYDEARRGWLYPLNDESNEEARGAFKKTEWNKLRVEAIGNTIKTWLNGISISKLTDDLTTEGFIALQVHAIGDSSQIGNKIQWRNIRILTTDLENNTIVSDAKEISFLVNSLTDTEIAEGWKLLFDGKTNSGWRKAYGEAFPEKGWNIEDGMLSVIASDGAESQNGGDIVTLDKYSNFDLKLQAKLTKGANSGIKYFVTEEEEGNTGSAIGLEFQLLDDKIYPDAKLGNHEGSRTLASLYDLIKAEDRRTVSIGEWNNVRIISNNNHVEHWLNGSKVLEYERKSEDFRKLVSESKYKDWPAFGEAEAGHILLQDHGNEVSFRSVKIKILD